MRSCLTRLTHGSHNSRSLVQSGQRQSASYLRKALQKRLSCYASNRRCDPTCVSRLPSGNPVSYLHGKETACRRHRKRPDGGCKRGVCIRSGKQRRKKQRNSAKRGGRKDNSKIKLHRNVSIKESARDSMRVASHIEAPRADRPMRTASIFPQSRANTTRRIDACSKLRPASCGHACIRPLRRPSVV